MNQELNEDDIHAEERESLIKKRTSELAMKDLESQWGKMNRKDRRDLLRARKHPSCTKRYASKRGKKKAQQDMQREVKDNRSDLK